MTTSPSETAIGVGIVGLSASGGWAGGAHVPALAAVDGVELRALATSSMASARAAGEHFGVPLVFDDVADLAARPEIDLVVVSVKVPQHRALVLPALAAGKAVLCEWPLGNGEAEAEELVTAAAGRRAFVGLQGRTTPLVRYLRDLVAEGYVGRVLSTTLVASRATLGGPVDSRSRYLIDQANGATMLTIAAGHTLDSLATVLGAFTDVSATTATQHEQVLDTETGEYVPMTAEDQVVISGRLAGGAVIGVHYRGGTALGTPFLWEINGTEGDLRITSAAGTLNASGVVLEGGRGSTGLHPLTVPTSYDLYPALAGTYPHGVAHLYERIVTDLTTGSSTAPVFADAARHHHLLAAVQRAAATGRRQEFEV